MRALPKFFAVLLVLAAPLFGFWLSPQAPTHVVIMHTNDIHGQLVPRAGSGGIAELATVIRNEHPDLILDAGDLFTGTFISDNFLGAPTIQAMNRIGYTSGTVGNHEFDYGQNALRMRLRDAKFPILSSNLQSRISEIKRYTVANAKGVRFGIIGLTSEELKTTTHPKNLNGVTVRDMLRTLQQILPEVRRLSDFIIVTVHAGEADQKRIANAFPEIRLIIAGHSHSQIGPVSVGQVLVTATGSSLRNAGRVDLDFEGRKLTRIEGKTIPLANVRPDPEIASIIASYESKVADKMKERVGEATAEFVRSSTSESPLADLIADAYREKGKTQIAFHNIGGIRAPIAKGPVTWGAIFEVLPFQNTMVTLKLTGAQLKQTLSRGLLAISGLRVEMDLKQPPGRQLLSVRLADGSPIEDAKLYSVTTNDFLVAGGDGFVELARGRETNDTGVLLRDIVLDYVKTKGVITPATDGRVVIR